jgi:hypothetical protein
VKTLKLEIDDDVYAQLNTAMGVRAMTGTMHGIVDEFVMLVLRSIEEGKETKRVQRNEKQRV